MVKKTHTSLTSLTVVALHVNLTSTALIALFELRRRVVVLYPEDQIIHWVSAGQEKVIVDHEDDETVANSYQGPHDGRVQSDGCGGEEDRVKCFDKDEKEDDDDLFEDWRLGVGSGGLIFEGSYLWVGSRF